MRVMQLGNRLGSGSRYRPLLFALMALILGSGYGFVMARSVSAWQLAMAPLALIAAVVIFRAPEHGVVLLIGVVWGFISEIGIKYHGLPSITEGLVVLLVGAVVLRRFSVGRTLFANDTTTWWMVAYLLVIAGGLWYAGDSQAVMRRIFDFAKDLFLFLLIINLLVSATSFERTMWLLLGVGAVLGTLTVYQELTQTYNNNYGGLARIKMAFITDEVGSRARAAGTTGEPLVYGQQLLVLVPIGLWGALYGRTLFSRAFAAYAAIACISGIVLSFSRSSYIAMIVVFVLFAVHIHLNPRYILLVMVLLAGLWRIAPPEFTARLNTLENLIPNPTSQGVNSEGSFRSRSSEMNMAVFMFLDHPIAGVGAGNYRDLYPVYIREHGSPVRDEERNAHSYYLEVAAEHGIIGLFVWGGILACAWTRFTRAKEAFVRAKNNRMAELAVALRIGFAGYLISAIFYHGGYPTYLWVQIGLAVALALIAQNQANQSTAAVEARR